MNIRFRKRAFDLCVSIILLPVVLILTLISAFFYFIIERENPLFFQKRVGLYGNDFVLVKLRTMSKETQDQATHTIDQSAVTSIGRIFRKTKLDELPQLYNVLVGNMSLVGPRPCLLSQTELIEERNKRNVLNHLPGITGLAQIQGVDMSDPARLAELDKKYCEMKSIANDIRILVKTLMGHGQGDKIKKQ